MKNFIKLLEAVHQICERSDDQLSGSERMDMVFDRLMPALDAYQETRCRNIISWGIINPRPDQRCIFEANHAGECVYDNGKV